MMDVGVNSAVSRRKFLGRAITVLGGATVATIAGQLTGGLLRGDLWGGTQGRWYEVVQDIRDPDKWHVNLFAGSALGDLEKGEHLSHTVVRVGDVDEIKGRLEYPARFQLRNGHRTQTF